MKLIAQIQLLPTPQAADALRRTLKTANAACNAISRVAWQTATFGKYALQKLVYHSRYFLLRQSRSVRSPSASSGVRRRNGS